MRGGNKMKRIGVIGAGSWGTALAVTLSDKGHSVKIWDLDGEHLKALKADRENVKYLPGIPFGKNLTIAMSIPETLADTDMVVFSAPAQHFRSALTSALPYLKNQIIVNVAKGIEKKTLLRMSEVAKELAPELNYVALSGPSHAEEVGQKLPTIVAVASEKPQNALSAQEVFMTNRFRVYTNPDLVGLELGGALKNIIALGAGISDGMGFGDNAKAALMTRGIAEIARLGVELGADRETFLGLSGIGDLIVTCTSMHSRNRRCGILIGQGVKPSEATKQIGMVVEGMFTAQAAIELVKKVGVEMPITEGIYKIINEEIEVHEAVELLMGREKKEEY